MRKISIKAFIVSNAASIGLFGLLLIALTFVSLVLEFGHLHAIAAAQSTKATADATIQSFRSSAAPAMLAAVSLVVAHLGAGYIGGLLASDARPINGALSSTFFLCVQVYTALFGFPFTLLGLHEDHYVHISVPEPIDAILSWGGPLFGLAGGYLASLIDGRTVARWLLAIPGSIAAYSLMAILAASLHSSQILVLAATAGILIAAAIVPAAHRLAAYVVFSVLIIATGLGLQLWRDSAIGLPFSESSLVYNGGGAFLAFLFGRRILAKLKTSRGSRGPTSAS